MKVLTIERAKWRRGNIGGPDTKLLDADNGLMCCLGFDALACGLKEADIEDIGSPEDLITFEDDENVLPQSYVETRLAEVNGAYRYYNNSDIVNQAIELNDDIVIDEETREAKLRETLLKLGWDDVVFV